MTQDEMFERSFLRPRSYFNLPESIQYQIDKELGILDWTGNNMTPDDMKRYLSHYFQKKSLK